MNNRIKSKLKTFRNSFVSYNFDALIDLAGNVEVVSFDIFDTLLRRNVPYPQDVFILVEEKYNKEHYKKIECFVSRRLDAEKKARSCIVAEEVTFEEIYLYFEGLSYEQKEELMKLELNIEYDLICANSCLLPFVSWCRENRKKMVCTSDMYFSTEFIRSLLDKCGFKDIVQLFVSSEYKKTKFKGTIFQLIIKDLNIKPNDILHIGDSRHSDFDMPKRFGMKSYQVPLKYDKRKKVNQLLIDKSDKFEFSCLQEFIDNNLDNNASIYYKFGFEKFGMLLWGFSSWLYQELKKNNIPKVYFFSRDGYIMKKIFDLEYSKDESLNTYYLEVSRRSLRVPILWLNSELENLLSMISSSMMIPLLSIFDGVGLDINKYKDIVNECNLSIDSKFYRNEILSNENIKVLYEKIKPDFLKKSKQEFNNLKLYIEQMKLSGKFAIVDIGWSGGMQRYLSEALDKLGINNEISGYYFGVADYVERNLEIRTMNLQGYIFDFANDKNAIDLRSSFVGLFETLFLEQGGSVKNYIRDDGCIKAQRYPYEYSVDGIIQDEANRVAELQLGALEFVNKIKQSRVFVEMKFSPVTLFSGIRAVGAFPRLADVRLFGDFGFFDEGQKEYLAKPKNILFYIIHLSTFKREFLQSRWKVGFMKRLFKIPFPYEKIYRKLLNFKK